MSLKDDVLVWAKEKGILDKSNPSAQMLKTVEEVGELASALGKKDMPEIKDAIGDIAVTIIIQAELNGLDFDDCLQSAYDIISKRKGKMVNGMFVKEQEKKKTKRSLKPDDVSAEVWRDFKKMRDAKKAPLTETALKGLEREAGKAGKTLEWVMKECATRGWRGFKAEWVMGKGKPAPENFEGNDYGDGGKL